MSTISSSTPAISRASTSQRSHVAAILSSAFHDDPIFSWIIPDADRRAKLLGPFFEVFADAFIPHDATFVTESSVAMWAPVGASVPADDQAEQFVTTLLELCGPDAARGEAVIGTIDSHHPHDPAAYLQFVGVEASRQGQGLGSAVMAPMLTACDRDGVAAFLVSTSEGSRKLYERHGFGVIEVLRVDDCPPMWNMWREPRNI
jgi:ribosomal protein S18 acetylase RimI-like enzyme